jgi:hypothetical protein
MIYARMHRVLKQPGQRDQLGAWSMGVLFGGSEAGNRNALFYTSVECCRRRGRGSVTISNKANSSSL